jgi:hypothetical protein
MRKDIEETNCLYEIDDNCRFWSKRTGKEVCKKGSVAQFTIKGFSKICRTKKSLYNKYFLNNEPKKSRTENEKILIKRFKNIKKRCYDVNNKQYKNYGFRGIKVFDKWLEDVDLFVKYCINNGFESHLSIDRIDNDGHYEPNNIRFVDSYVQNNNTRANIKINDNGEILTVSQFCRKHNLKPKKIYSRLHTFYNNDVEKMYIDFLNGDLFNRKVVIKVIVNSQELSLRELSEKYSIDINIIRSRYKRGYRDELLIRPIRNRN